MNNNQVQKVKFSTAIQTPTYQKLIKDTLGDKKKAEQFITAITSAVATNPTLQECDPATILSCGLLGTSLNLVPSPQLGQFYLVPFKKKDKSVNAQFVLGYKGYLQLAIRSGYYEKINVVEIKEGELISFDPLEEEIKVKLIDDFEEREKAKTIGYYAMFKYTNGFKKAIYWSKEKMESHADKFSQGFKLSNLRKLENGEILDNEKWRYSSNWYTDFDGMAKKTMLRQLLSKWGIMSIELQQAIENDDKLVSMKDGNFVIEDANQVEIISPTETIEDNFFKPDIKNEMKGQVKLDEL